MLELALLALVGALSPVTIKGNAFYNGSDTRFYIRGVDYQPGGSSNLTDPLMDVAGIQRDVKYFTELGLNTVRVYSVDNSQDHNATMQILADAGIYVLIDVNTPSQSLNRFDNATLAASYNSGYLQHVFATIDSFAQYPNTLGFFAANEVINSENTTEAAPYIKAVVRDMKAYIKAQSPRQVPVGYSAADVAESRWQQMEYLNCGNDEGERIDFFGMNDYSWCGTSSSFQISGWAQNVESYGNYSIPMFLSEYGCNTQRPRQFPEVASLYSTQMSSVYSGGLVYEYFNQANDYGLVELNGDNVTTLQDFTNLQSQLAANPDPTGAAGASETRVPAECPSYQSGVWDVENGTLPVMPAYAKRYLTDGAGKGLGFDGPDTQSGSQLDNPDAMSSSSSTSSTHEASSKMSSSTASSSKSSLSSTSSSMSVSSTVSTSSSSSSRSSSSSNGGNAAELSLAPFAILALWQYLL